MQTVSDLPVEVRLVALEENLSNLWLMFKLYVAVTGVGGLCMLVCYL